MGADGAATLGALGHNTVLQPVKKLYKISDCIIAGVSGPIGLGQRIVGTLEQLWDDKTFRGPSFQVMTAIRAKTGPHMVQEIQFAAEAAKIIGHSIASISALCTSIVAAPIDGRLHLFEFDHTGAPEEITENIPFTAIGSGKNLADPFLAFLRRVFWPKRLPNLSEGVFVTMWSLVQAIRTNTGGVAEPIQLMTLSQNERGTCVIKEFDEDELGEHREAIEEVEQNLGRYKQQEAEPPPVPPRG